MFGQIASRYDLILFDHPPNQNALMRCAVAASRWVISPVTRSLDAQKALIDVGEMIADTNQLESANVRFLGAYLIGIHQKSNARKLREKRASLLEILPMPEMLFDTSIVGNPDTAEELETAGLSPAAFAQLKVETDEKIAQADFLDRRKIPRFSATALKLAEDYEDLTDELLERIAKDQRNELYG